MQGEIIISIVLFFCLFFGFISVFQIVSKKTAFPFTVAILIAGFITQFIFYYFGYGIDIKLDSTIIYYLLLPLLLFESAIHINFHQFRLQFWTIAFMSTFGLLVSLFVIGFGLNWVLGLPLGMALLFGALISATDPIAVLSIFKSLGAPKRLSLIADGESMFNDATAVIAFRVISGFALAGTYIQGEKIFVSFGNFLYMFIGSLLVGALLGYLGSELIRKVKNNHLVEVSITLSLALGAFIISEHFLYLSGVITVVIAGLVFGNLGKTRISYSVSRFVSRTWEYIAFVAVSLVFFFASFQLDVSLLLSQFDKLHIVILLVLMARAISVYLSFYISNKLVFFKNEPDVPLKWQHILNWGGLRGVIPLVLAYSIPDSYLYKNYVLSFTLATLVFTLLINALTIRWLLVKLGLHLPKKEEEILKEQLEIFDVEKRRDLLADLPERDFYKELVDIASVKLDQEEQYHKKKLLELANTQELENSLRLQAIEITRDKIFNLYHKGYISESIVYEYDSQLDLQQDAVEYPEVYFGRGYGKGGRIPNQKIFRQKLRSLDQLVRNFPTLRKFWGQKENDLILKRLMLLKTKIICVDEIIDYLDKVESLVKENKEACGGVEVVLSEYYARKEEYEINLTNLKEQYPDVVRNYQYDLLHVLLAIK